MADMTRRGVFGAFAAGVAAITGTPPVVNAISTEAAADAELVVIRHKGLLSERAREAMATAWREAAIGTSLEHAKVVVLDEGVGLDLISKRGEVRFLSGIE